MKNLNKENCFDDLMIKYPNAMKHFCKWIDDYKNEVNWNKLFSENNDTMQLHSSKYKFHEIPIEMQIGIFTRFKMDCEGTEYFEDMTICLYKDIVRVFKDIENIVK